MTEYARLIAFIEKRVKDTENTDLFRSWLNMSRDDIIDFKVRDWFAAMGLLRHKS